MFCPSPSGSVGVDGIGPPDTVRRLAVIDTAQRAGLSLQEIIELLGASLGDPAAAERLRQVAEHKLPEMEALIERAEVAKRWLQAAAACRCPTLEDCPLFIDPAVFARALKPEVTQPND